MRTQVGIIGGGPSGLLLSQLLDVHGIDSIVLERKSRDYVLSRIRAGVLEEGATELLKTAEVSENLELYGDSHSGVDIVFNGDSCRIDLAALTGGKTVTVYGQTEVTKDLYNARDARNGKVIHEVEDVALHELSSGNPYITYTKDGNAEQIDCDYVVGCDGFHGISRKTIPESDKSEFELAYPFGWLGVLSETPPASEELIYAYHERGFALCSMRSKILSRYYIQVPIDEKLEDWPDDRFWAELKSRLPDDVANNMVTGPSIEKSIAPLRSFVCEPMRWNSLFLVGDAAHIVPPTGAKGLNLAASDVYYLYNAFVEHYKNSNDEGLRNYSDKALSRVWKSVRFSWSLTKLLHRFPEDSQISDKVRCAEFDYLKSSEAAKMSLAESYVGMPY